jgi:hypothetical protein
MKWGADPFIPPRRQKHSEEPQPVLGRPPDDLSIKERMLRGEWSLMTLSHNLLKIHRAQLRSA